MKKRFLKVGIVLVVAVAGFACTLYIASVFLKWITNQVDNLDPTIAAALIVGGLTVLGSVAVSSISARRAQERVAQEANIGRKAEVYEQFMEFLVDIMKSSKDSKDLASKDYDEFFFRFASKVTIYGGPKVVRAFGEWRESGDDPEGGRRRQLSLVESFIREMRTDLGESNKGIPANQFLGLFVAGGKTKVTEELGNLDSN